MSYYVSNLNILGRYVFEILAKILLGALGISLSIYEKNIVLYFAQYYLSLNVFTASKGSSVYILSFMVETKKDS